jgi:hypothetical protein
MYHGSRTPLALMLCPLLKLCPFEYMNGPFRQRPGAPATVPPWPLRDKTVTGGGGTASCGGNCGDGFVLKFPLWPLRTSCYVHPERPPRYAREPRMRTRIMYTMLKIATVIGALALAIPATLYHT